MQTSYVTIDFWGTLFKSNPDYADYRDRLIIEYIASNTKEVVVLNSSALRIVYNDCKIFFNQCEFTTGRSFAVEHKHQILFKLLGINPQLANSTYFEMLRKAIEKHPPVLINSIITEIMPKLCSSYYVSILSNTGMIPSEYMKYMVDDLSSNSYDQYHFSDQVSYAKPSKDFFNLYLSKGHSDKKSKWLHIGDDYQRDIKPVKELGGKAFHIKSNEDWLNIKDLLL